MPTLRTNLVLDVAIGNILKAIDDEGIRENTIVMFFSTMELVPWATMGISDSQLYEAGTRMPAAIRLPAGVEASNQWWCTTCFPTLVDAIGLKTDLRTPFDGESMWDTLRTGKSASQNRHRYRYCDGIFSSFRRLQISKIERGPQELVELFKIYEDPNETTNVANGQSEIVDKLVAKHLNGPR